MCIVVELYIWGGVEVWNNGVVDMWIDGFV